ncbi:PUA-like domain-containing protein [Haematococcus lacustris]
MRAARGPCLTSHRPSSCSFSSSSMAPRRRANAVQAPEPPASEVPEKLATKKRKATAAAAPGPPVADKAAEASNSAVVQHYLIKQEPEEFSFDDLMACKNQTWTYDGVRNHQARNTLLRMRRGDQLLFHYSSCKPPRIVGIVEVAREAYPDHHARDPASKYFDAASTEEDPRWYLVDIRAVRRLPRDLPLHELRAVAKKDPCNAIGGMLLLTRPRLSVQTVTQEQWDAVMQLADKQADASEEEG